MLRAGRPAKGRLSVDSRLGAGSTLPGARSLIASLLLRAIRIC